MSGTYKSNKTFGDDANFNFNACVGKNGRVRISDYQFGYQLAVNILIDYLKKDTRYIDPLIYPLLFSARHGIELFIKETINNLEIINKMVNKKYQYKNHLLIHDISILWDYLKTLASFDKRIREPISQLNEYITDYFLVDLTGETFRYPFDTKNKHHLDDFSVINVLKFERRFKEMSPIIEYILYLVDRLGEEYSMGTFICGLSRYEIEEISKKLPQKNKWIAPSFDVISAQIKLEYNITSNNLYSRILNLIKKHKEFSCNIGIINISTVLNKNDYDFYKNEYLNTRDAERPKGIQTTELNKLLKLKGKRFSNFLSRINKKNGLTKATKKPFLEVKYKFVDSVINRLSLESIAALCAFYEVGHGGLYSEQYEKIFIFYCNEDKYKLVFDKLADGFNRIDDIEKGIKKCGQLHLL
jgi:hypothetical protein